MNRDFTLHKTKPSAGAARTAEDHGLTLESSHASYPFWKIVSVILLILLLLFVLNQVAHGGGPKYIAGVSFFDPAVKGTPLTWSQGTIHYYTDQGDLSPVLAQDSANAFVADAFNHWTSVSTAAIATTRAGELNEDVSGQNVIANPDGSVTLPDDIVPTAVDKPVAVVYDADGKVTDALLGLGAGDPLYCFTNAAYGGIDNFSSDAHLLHALVVINGNCVQSASQLPDVTYRLVRVFGRVFGLDWSQANVNVQSRNPVPTPDDFAGFPVMHYFDLISCVPISACYSDADQPKMDDRAAISRLYPVTADNAGNFPGKKILADNTVHIYGSLHFADSGGQAAQPMQGVNVIARWIDPATGVRSGKYVAASVSGYLFRGNAGNPVTGYTDAWGNALDTFGSDDPLVEGFFDLAGLEIPDGSGSAQYELRVEGVDPFWSTALGPYGPWQVQPSGNAQPLIVSVSLGGATRQDIVVQDGATEAQDWREPDTYLSPTAVPPAADWMGSLSGYGDGDYARFFGQANRTLSVEVTAVDGGGAATESKAMPVICIWQFGDPEGTPCPAPTHIAFNTGTFGFTQLKAQLFESSDFRIGISDFRGDGRPDYRYQARIFYGDSIAPDRASVRGGTPLALRGLGFRSGNTATVGTASASVLATEPGQLLLIAPPFLDGVQSIALSDPATGASSVLADVLTYGAGPDDNIRLILGSNPPTPVGGQATNPTLVQVVAADGVTPISGASVVFSSTPAVAMDACGGGSSCTVYSDENGQASTHMTVLSAGTITITAQLAPASYASPKYVQGTLLGTSSALDEALMYPYQSIAQGATLDVPLTARVLSKGVPQKGRTVNYVIEKGAGKLSAGSATTDSNGYASVNLHITAMAADVQVSACVEPGDNPCQTFYLTSVDPGELRLEPVADSFQVVALGQPFQAVTVQVTDSGTPSNPVRGAPVTFHATVYRPDQETPVVNDGDVIIGRHASPVILSSSQATVASDGSGMASMTPSAGSYGGEVEIEGAATVWSGASLEFWAESLWVADMGKAQEKNERVWVEPPRR